MKKGEFVAKWILIIAVGGCILAWPGALLAGHREGNGGDSIRASFLNVGDSVIAYLRETAAGVDLSLKRNLNVEELAAQLSIDVVKVVDDPLQDNGGSLVDALGKPGEILLNQNRWYQLFESQQDVAYLVFHELLRAVGVNDDNYVISRALAPFPVERQVITRSAPAVPLINEQSLEGVIDLSNAAVSGSGCPQRFVGTFVEFDSERNALNVLTDRFRVEAGGAKSVAYQTCDIALPFKVPAGFRLVLTQVDLSGVTRLAADGRTRLAFEAYLAGQSGTVFEQQIKGATSGSFLLRENRVLTSGCGGAGVLRLHTSARLTTSGGISQTALRRIGVDLKLEPCKLPPH